MGKVNQVAIRHGFRAFYRTLVETHDIARAVDELRLHVPACSGISAEKLFELTWNHYRDTLSTPQMITVRAARIIEKLRSSGRPPWVLRLAAAQLPKQLKATIDPSQRESLRRQFLMLDLFPEDKSRFSP